MAALGLKRRSFAATGGAMDERSARQLLQDVGRGDRRAMKSVYETYSDAVYRFAQSWLGDPFEAADVMHETMLEVWRNASAFSGRSAVRTWIFSIARNKAVDHNRRAARTASTEADETVADDAPSPQEITSALQDARRIRACMDTLSPPHRAVIHLTYFEDLPYSEIAEIEDCPVGTVKTRMMHAKQLMLRCLTAKARSRE